MKIQKQNSLGFTLIELIVVIAIIGIISGIVLQALGSARIRSRDAARLATIDQLQKAFEVSATLTGTNQLPSTAGGYICLGLTADTAPTCGYSAPMTPGSAPAIAVNTPLVAAIANKVIPVDPSFNNGIGTAYRYNSSVIPATTPVTTTLGAYLSWVMEGTATCGRGVPYASNPITNGTQCFLRIGNAI